MSPEEAAWTMQVNFLSPMWTSFAAIPHMLKAGSGAIVNVSSLGGRIVPPRETIYAASKSALNAFSEGLLADLAGSGIHVALILPGPIDTEIWDKEDEPVAFDGKKHPPELVTAAIFEAIENRIAEIVVPKRDPQLILARLLRTLAPGVLRRGLRRTDPVPKEIVKQARARAARGQRLGDLGPKEGSETPEKTSPGGSRSD